MNKRQSTKVKDMKLRFEPEVKARLAKVAAREHRSQTNLAYVFVVRGIEAAEAQK